MNAVLRQPESYDAAEEIKPVTAAFRSVLLAACSANRACDNRGMAVSSAPHGASPVTGRLSGAAGDDLIAATTASTYTAKQNAAIFLEQQMRAVGINGALLSF